MTMHSGTGVPPSSDSRTATGVIVEHLARLCPDRFGPSLRAVLLTGSLARGEATFVRGQVALRSLGDVDCFLVFHNADRLPSDSEIRLLTHEVSDSLKRCGIQVKLALDPVHDVYLKCLPRHIATYEMRCCGRVIHGDRTVLSMIPSFESAEISLEDAWRMLGNRIIEFLDVLAAEAHPDETLSPGTRYRAAKLFLDMATSWLIFAGCYSPTYRERASNLWRIAQYEPGVEAPFPLRNFAGIVSACTRFKLSEEAGLPPDGLLLNDAISYAQQLWKWELAFLTGARSGEISGLMRRWMRSQRASVRWRGWASVLRRSGWHSWPNWPRWLCLGCVASPRYWAYYTAAEILTTLPGAFRRDTAAASGLGRLAHLLPSGVKATDWRALTFATMADYRRYLLTTLA